MILLKNIVKSFDKGADKTLVLRGVNAGVREGEFVTIMGPSGAGKTTLLSIIGMLDSAWSGEYFFLDKAVHKLSLKVRVELHKQNIGFVFQQYHLIDGLTVFENLEIPLTYRNIARKERDSMIAAAMERFHLTDKKSLYPSKLSGGIQQLIGVARAVIAKPKLILADEPTGNLHSEQGREIMELFKRLNKEGTTIIQVTHSELNASYSDRIIRLFDGAVTDE